MLVLWTIRTIGQHSYKRLTKSFLLSFSRLASVILVTVGLIALPAGAIFLRGCLKKRSRPENACPLVLEFKDISEMALTRAPEVNIISSSGFLLIARKQ